MTPEPATTVLLDPGRRLGAPLQWRRRVGVFRHGCLAIDVERRGGHVIERWLFFVEAKHTVMLYYGADAV